MVFLLLTSYPLLTERLFRHQRFILVRSISGLGCLVNTYVQHVRSPFDKAEDAKGRTLFANLLFIFISLADRVLNEFEG